MPAVVPAVSVVLQVEVAAEAARHERSAWSPLVAAAVGVLFGCEEVQEWRPLAQKPPD